MKYRVREDVTVSVSEEGTTKDPDEEGRELYAFRTRQRSFKQGEVEVTDSNRAALEQLETMGLAEPVKSSTKEE